MIEQSRTRLARVFSGGFSEAKIIQTILLDNHIKATLENGFMASIAPWIISPGGNSPVNVVVKDSDLNVALKLIGEFKSTDGKEKL